MIKAEKILIEDIEKREAMNPDYYYEAKLPSIQLAQELGLSDSDIEKAFAITIKAADRKS